MQRPIESRCGIPLHELLPDAQILGNGRQRVTACCSEASQCQPGDLFVAITGAEHDGHDQFQTAIQAGATAIVAEQLLPVQVPQCLVSDSRIAYGEVCHQLSGKPSEQLKTIGVTGTHGKTTVSELLAAILRKAGADCGLSTTRTRHDGVNTKHSHQTTPPAAGLAQWFANSVANGCTHSVVEASSTALANRQLAGTTFDGVILTNVRRAHLDFHNTVSNYRRAKRRILEHLKPNGFAIVNADDPTLESILPELNLPVLTFGRRCPADVSATIVERFQGEQTFLLHAGNDTVPVRTRMIGDHHVSNCLAAATAALALNIPLTAIARGLESMDRIPGRLDRVECGQEFGVFVDCADDPDRLAVTLRAVRQVTPGRVICLFNADAKSRDDRAMLGRVAEKSSDISVVTCGDPGDPEPYQSIHDALDGYDRVARAHVIPSRSQAIQWALGRAQKGDSVVITGTAPHAVVPSGTKHSVSEFEFTRNWLYEQAEPHILPMHV